MKHLLATLITLACLILALLPEIFMFMLWNYISPTTTLEKVFTVGVFGLAGGSACFFCALLAFAIWANLLDTLY